jgi:hypothetical protein
MLFKRTTCNISPLTSKVSLDYRKKRICEKAVVNAQQMPRRGGIDSKGNWSSPRAAVLRLEDASMAMLEHHQLAQTQARSSIAKKSRWPNASTESDWFN